MWNRCSLLLVMILLTWADCATADTFTVKEDDGNEVIVEARFAGESRGLVLLERRNGQLQFIPQEQILKRVAGLDPEPCSTAEMIAELTEKFGADKFRAHSEGQYVVGLVLSEPLPKVYESKAATCLKKSTAFMKTVEKVFLDFVNDLRIDTEKPRFPLVLLIFETDDDFVRFSAEETGGKGLAAESMKGFYNGLTNRLVIRMSECHTFMTPLHEAIHQQVHNRGLLNRLAPVPVWFNEGIATGFEGNGEKISGGPTRINVQYAKAALQAKIVNWDDVVADDKAFRGSDLAGEAYAHAWSIHWFLVTKYRKQYVEYLQLVGQKSTLQQDSGETRVRDFEQVFGKRAGEVQQEFRPWLEQAAKKQHVSFKDHSRVGHSICQSNLAEVEIAANLDKASGTAEVEGEMRNMSLIRPMSFLITVETSSGSYVEWHVPNVGASKSVKLSKKFTLKKMKGAPAADQEQGAPPMKFWVKVKAVVPESEAAKSWLRGELPVPEFRDN